MSQSLRIVHCFRSPVGGIFRHVRDLTDAQVAAGHKVGIVCDSSTGGAYEERLFQALEPKLELGVWRTPMQRHVGPGDLAAAWRTYRIIKGLQPDILHGHSAKGGVYSRVFGSLLRVSRFRVARLYSPHGGSLHYDASTMTGRAVFLLERAVERFSDHILFVSRYERDTYGRKIGGPSVPSSIVYNGVTPAEFVPVAPTDDATDFLYIGMMRDLKGPDLFIEALAMAETDLGRPLTATMVGAGDDRDRYKALAARLGLAERVAFHDPMPAREAFALARTVVVPSRAEAMPYIVLEALAAGRPMIASSVGGIPEIFESAPGALVAPDARAIADKMVLAMNDPLAWAASMPSAEEVRARFSIATMARDIDTVYRSVIAGR
ncbi:glycosyltransferase family 1 protein [Aquibium carbonis]|uniref:Glycosyltransferase family 1 protein n=1 Tax=Aquibium carbonis TaxID=2495581 RepID=A0A3R9ZTH4_9HYPH|nr:glycosyltransferase family 4 protein [Aquibium carbonis]RST87333.1 glycosyltransferase family 1 protein [Aquibium carbonis]